MPESSTIQALANCAAPQQRKRIPVTGANWPSTKAKYQHALGQLTSFRHQNVEAVHEVHIDPAKDCYLICERLEGDALSALLTRERRLSLDMVRSITRQAASALTAAHDLGLMHGNLSPQAILVQRTDPPDSEGSLRIKVCDFGLGKPLAPDLFGALGYLAPEQVDPKEPRPEPTQLSDQFALAVITFEMLAGRRAFPGDTLDEIAPKLLRQDPIHFQIPGISQKESDRIIAGLHKALSRLPSERYSSLSEFVAAIEGRAPNKGSRGSVIDPSRFAAEHRGPIQLGASVAQALVVATQNLPGKLDVVRPGQDAQTLTLVRTMSQQSAQAATLPMMPRLDVQVNVNTTIANQNDSHVRVVLPQQPGPGAAAPPGARLRRIALAGLTGAVLAVALLLASMHPWFAERRSARILPPPVENISTTPVEKENPHESPPAQPPPAKDGVTPKPAKPRKPAVSAPRKPHKTALLCTPTNKLAATLSQHLNECSSTIGESARDTALVLPFEVASDGHPMLSMSDPAPQGPPALVRCLRNFVMNSPKADLGPLPRAGIVLRCVIK